MAIPQTRNLADAVAIKRDVVKSNKYRGQSMLLAGRPGLQCVKKETKKKIGGLLTVKML